MSEWIWSALCMAAAVGCGVVAVFCLNVTWELLTMSPAKEADLRREHDERKKRRAVLAAMARRLGA